MSYRVSAKSLSPIRLNVTDPVDSVLQNVAIILRTKRGTVPLYREFGITGAFLDKPILAATPMMFAEIKEAVEEYEPRAEIVDIKFEIDAANPGRLIPTVEVNIIDA